MLWRFWGDIFSAAQSHYGSSKVNVNEVIPSCGLPNRSSLLWNRTSFAWRCGEGHICLVVRCLDINGTRGGAGEYRSHVSIQPSVVSGLYGYGAADAFGWYTFHEWGSSSCSSLQWISHPNLMCWRTEIFRNDKLIVQICTDLRFWHRYILSLYRFFVPFWHGVLVKEFFLQRRLQKICTFGEERLEILQAWKLWMLLKKTQTISDVFKNSVHWGLLHGVLVSEYLSVT